jgi:cell wall-associated NlpC family hydrolase
LKSLGEVASEVWKAITSVFSSSKNNDSGSSSSKSKSSSAAGNFRASQSKTEKIATLNTKVAATAESFVGGGYKLGGSVPTTEGGEGIDCSESPRLGAKRAAGVEIRDRTADEQAKDPKLMVKSNGKPGSVNFYDWSPSDGIFDHATVIVGGGKEVHPSSNSGTIKLVDQGSLNKYAGTVVNKEYNWNYILGD